MRFTSRRFFLAVAATLIAFTPFAEGALRPARFWPLCACAPVAAFYAFAFNSRRAGRIAIIIVSSALTITAADLALRLTSVVPYDLAETWPRMPLVNRYRPDLKYEGYRFNDLSRMAGVKEWREDKFVRVFTDSAGFRNGQTDSSRPLDVIVLGDSFGAGAVSQEYTLSSILAKNYHLSTYDLSAPAIGPW